MEIEIYIGFKYSTSTSARLSIGSIKILKVSTLLQQFIQVNQLDESCCDKLRNLPRWH